MATIQSIGRQLREIRNRKKLSAPVVAERAAVHPNTLRSLETGKGNVELSRLLSILEALDLDLVIVPKEVAASRAAEDATTSTELSEKLERLMKKIQ